MHEDMPVQDRNILNHIRHIRAHKFSSVVLRALRGEFSFNFLPQKHQARRQVCEILVPFLFPEIDLYYYFSVLNL